MPDSDALCSACVRVDLFSLFTGPRYYPGEGHEYRTCIDIGTLQEVKENSRCPLCRLVKHDLYGQNGSHPWEYYGKECNPVRVLCSLIPFRVDYGEDTKYQNKNTCDMLATRLEVRLSGMPGCSKEEVKLIERRSRGNGIQLLSPTSVDPARPLQNGFRATTMQNSLELLSRWINTCRECHQETCRLEQTSSSHLESRLEKIRVIKIQERKLVELDPAAINYAALSYVWGQEREAYTRLADELWFEQDKSKTVPVFLPSTAPKSIEDAILVCKTMSIPYLWVDLYCIQQNDNVRKATEIQAMGYIYHHSEITLVAASTSGLLSAKDFNDITSVQIIETIGNRQYISALPSITGQIQASTWCTRGWCFQEGQLSRRIAFFGDYDVSFMCGAGHWREAFHSGKYGHDANIRDVDLRSRGYYTLSALSWLRDARWYFAEYESIVLAYSQRKLSYESDRLDAISGCLNILARKKDIHFFSGLPSVDFHYALLWEGEYDRPRSGFPSWSWAGWHAMNQLYFLGPHESTSGFLIQTGNDSFGYQEESPRNIELQGLLISSGRENPHQPNKCLQRLALLSVSRSNAILTVQSEVTRFFVDITADPHMKQASDEGWEGGHIPTDFDTTGGQYLADWDPQVEYTYNSYSRLHLKDSSGNVLEKRARWYDHEPFTLLFLPGTLRGSTLTWLLRDGIELIKIVDVKLVDGTEKLKPFHHILCLGIDRSEGIQDRVRRMGVFCIPKEAWDKAGPNQATVNFS